MIKTNKGFTLIELLVVIAIIGILSSVVLASLNTARNKGADAAIKSQLAALRAQAEITYDTNQCYSTAACSPSAPAVAVAAACATGNAITATIFSEARFYGQITSAITASGGGFSSCAETVGGGAWAVGVQLKGDLTKAWCVDSTGASKQIADSVAYTQTTLDADVVGGVCGS